jgi:tetratricopeptide (TPR) repeat protein
VTPAGPSPVLALFNEGVDHLADGDLDEAARLFGEALAVDADFPDACYNLALTRHRQGRLDDAVNLYWRVVGLAPGFAETHTNLGAALQALDRPFEALACFRRAVELDPADPDKRINLGDQLRGMRRPAEAVEAFQPVLALRPSDAGALMGIGAALLDQGQAQEALQFLESAIEQRHDLSAAHANRSIALRDLSRAEEALRAAELAAAFRPDNTRTLMVLGDACLELGYVERAIEAYSAATMPGPDEAQAHHKLGLALTQRDRLEEARDHLEQALALLPEDAVLIAHMGNVAAKQQRIDEALGLYHRAIGLDPKLSIAWANMGILFHDMQCFDDALDCYAQVRAISKDRAVADYNESATRLVLGQLEAGFRLYEARAWIGRLAGRQWNYPQPQWDGRADPAGTTILAHAEQGIGDTLQFCRYLPLLADRGAHVVARMQKPVASLIATIDPRVEVIDDDRSLPSFDWHVPLLSLPFAFKTTLETIPRRIPYLTVPAEPRERWRAALPKGAVRRVGLAWAGNPSHQNDAQRSIPFQLLLPLLDRRDIAFVSVQKTVNERDRAAYESARTLYRCGESLLDFGDTAGLISQLDLVISVDTSVAHLTGALGLPVWVLVTWAPEWRWLLERPDSPWYPTARLFRQPAQGDWEGVVEAVGRALDTEFTGRAW